jgi:Uma2 family endonuclease
VLTPVARHRYSYSEYVTLEEYSSVRYEFLNGEIYAMAGGTPTHAALAAAIIHLIRAQLPFGCRAYSSDLRVRVPETGLSTYPDAKSCAAEHCGPRTIPWQSPIQSRWSR